MESDYLKILRARGLSLRKFSKLIGMSPEWIGKAMRGEVLVSKKTQSKIDSALCVCPVCKRKLPPDFDE